MYAIPESEPVPLDAQPRLEPGAPRGSRPQRDLEAFLDIVREKLRPSVARLRSDFALRLDVGLPA